MDDLIIFFLLVVLILWALATITGKKKAPAPKPLAGKQVAILIEEKFEEREYYSFYDRLQADGASIKNLSVEAKAYKSNGTKTETALAIAAESAEKYHGILIPESDGCGRLRNSADVKKFIGALNEKAGVVAAIGRAVCVLISSIKLKDRKATCAIDIKDDLNNVEAKFTENEAVVKDGNLITSRGFPDVTEMIPVFVDALKSK